VGPQPFFPSRIPGCGLFYAPDKKTLSSAYVEYIRTYLVLCQDRFYTFIVKSEKLPAFAFNLSRIRKQRGLSQADLAEMAGLTRRTINHYENHVSQPPMEKVEAIANALNIKTSDLLDKNSGAAVVHRNIDLTGIDPRSVKKLKDILSLSVEDRNDLYRILNKMLRKNQLEKQETLSYTGDPVKTYKPA
jgi:transcriptional regulator with XRE-family HTH domain